MLGRLAVQLDEILVLESIYGDDFIMDDSQRENRRIIEGYVEEDEVSGILLPLQFSVKLKGGNQTESNGFIVTFSIQEGYPKDCPQVNISSDIPQVSRKHLQQLVKKFNHFLLEAIGQECLFQALEWLDSEIESLRTSWEVEDSSSETQAITYTRIWMYFHHIYSKKKRKFIVDLANQMKLSGFCLSGKPGVICIEGEHSACESYYQSLRSLAWQKMTVRLNESSDSVQWLRFRGFHEIQMNPSTFRAYLQEHDSENVFEIIYQI